MKRSSRHYLFIPLIFILGICFAALLSMGFGVFSQWKSSLEEEVFALQAHLKSPHPLRVDRELIAIVIAEKNKPVDRRALNSIFDQTYKHFKVVYVDNGTADGSFEELKEHIRERQMEERTEAICYKERRAKLKILYEVIHQCDKDAVIVLIEGGDWLAHEHVFDHLNRAYAHPDVWMTYSRSISTPDYGDIKGVIHPDIFFIEKQFRHRRELTFEGLKSFYAGFFQAIRLQDLLFRGTFIDAASDLAFSLPLVEMGKEHILFLDEVAYVKRRQVGGHLVRSRVKQKRQAEAYLRLLPLYKSINHWRWDEVSSRRYIGDVVIFSEDRPLQLYALLESLSEKVADMGKIQVIYEGSNPILERAYLELEKAFPSIEFLAICDYPTHTFNHLLFEALFQGEALSPYVLFLDDRIVVTKEINLNSCVHALEKTHADHFMIKTDLEEVTSPIACTLDEGIVAKQLETGIKSGLDNLLLCRKELFLSKKWKKAHTLSSFKRIWGDHCAPRSVALFFDRAKAIRIKSSSVASKEQKREWAYRLIEGFKIDIASFLCEREAAQEGSYPLIRRQKRETISFGHSVDAKKNLLQNSLWDLNKGLARD